MTCDVAAHYPHLSAMDIGYFNAHCHVIPPYASATARPLAQAVADEVSINAICSGSGG